MRFLLHFLFNIAAKTSVVSALKAHTYVRLYVHNSIFVAHESSLSFTLLNNLKTFYTFFPA